MAIYRLGEHTPQIHPTAFIAENATIIGNVNNVCNYNYVKDAYTLSGTAGAWDNAFRVFYALGRTYSIKLKINF